jgi:hypothetical protein
MSKTPSNVSLRNDAFYYVLLARPPFRATNEFYNVLFTKKTDSDGHMTYENLLDLQEYCICCMNLELEGLERNFTSFKIPTKTCITEADLVEIAFWPWAQMLTDSLGLDDNLPIDRKITTSLYRQLLSVAMKRDGSHGADNPSRQAILEDMQERYINLLSRKKKDEAFCLYDLPDEFLPEVPASYQARDLQIKLMYWLIRGNNESVSTEKN